MIQEYSRHRKLARVCREAGFTKVFEVGQYLMNPKSEPKSVLGDNTKIGPSRDVLVTGRYARYGIEVKIESLKKDGSTSTVV